MSGDTRGNCCNSGMNTETVFCSRKKRRSIDCAMIFRRFSAAGTAIWSVPTPNRWKASGSCGLEGPNLIPRTSEHHGDQRMIAEIAIDGIELFAGRGRDRAGEAQVGTLPADTLLNRRFIETGCVAPYDLDHGLCESRLLVAHDFQREFTRVFDERRFAGRRNLHERCPRRLAA